MKKRILIVILVLLLIISLGIYSIIKMAGPEKKSRKDRDREYGRVPIRECGFSR